MLSKAFLLSLVVLLSVSVCTYSDVTSEEIVAALDQILTELETASTQQATISEALAQTQTRQDNISATLTTLQMERLPAISQQVRLLEDSFNDYEAKDKRDDALMIGALGVTLLIAVLSLIF
jgi:predicted  nucleic acid-binding Zn-ribbon protein